MGLLEQMKQIFSMLPSTLQQRKNTFLFEQLIIHHSTTTLFLTTHLQSSNSCLKWSAREFQIDLVIRKNLTKLTLSMKQHQRIVDIFDQCPIIIAMSNAQNARRNRNGKVVWFNPPYSQNVKTAISELFIKLVRKHFLKKKKTNTIRFSTKAL